MFACQVFRVREILICISEGVDLTSSQSLQEFAAPQDVIGNGGRRRGKEKFQRFLGFVFANMDFRLENTKLPVQIGKVCGIVVPVLSGILGLVSISLLKQATGLCILLIKRGPLIALAAEGEQ